jgi:hypothetical protein
VVMSSGGKVLGDLGPAVVAWTSRRCGVGNRGGRVGPVHVLKFGLALSTAGVTLAARAARGRNRLCGGSGVRRA